MGSIPDPSIHRGIRRPKKVHVSLVLPDWMASSIEYVDLCHFQGPENSVFDEFCEFYA